MGLGIKVHHCGTKISYEIFEFAINETCNCNHLKETSFHKCCKEKHIIVKAIDSDKIGNKTIAFNKTYTTFLATFFIDNHTANINLLTNTNTVFKHEYPPRYSPPIYILNKFFLI
jgi:hypothetical protein